jgi:nucleotide-binding universal stress UspA family protein
MQGGRSIVAGTDFSEASRRAISAAARLACARGAALHVAHAIDAQVIDDLHQAVGLTHEEVRTDAVQNATGRLAAFATDVPSAELHVVVGTPFAELARLVKTAGADLLVLGATGASVETAREHHAGSLAVRCVRNAPCDVMLLRSQDGRPFRTIAACVDFSPSSDAVLARATEIARLEAHDRIDLLHVVDPAKPEHDPAGAPARLAELLARHAQQTSGIVLQPHVVEGHDAGRAIESFVLGRGGDLVVLGATGRTGLTATLLGTTAERVMHHGAASVLVVKPDQVEGSSVPAPSTSFG